MTVEISVTEQAKGYFDGVCEIRGHLLMARSRGSIVGAVAREVAASRLLLVDDDWTMVGQWDGRLRLRGGSIFRMAQIDLEDGNKRIRRVLWRLHVEIQDAECPVCGERQFMFKGTCLACLPVGIGAAPNRGEKVTVLAS